jgi:hypothetical protein
MRWLLVSLVLVAFVAVGCGSEKIYGPRDVERAFASHGLRLIKIRSQPLPTFTTLRRPRHITVFLYRNHRDADAAVQRKKGRSVFSAFGIPKPANIGGIFVFRKRNVVAIDVTPNISKTPNVGRSIGTPGFVEAVEGLP